MISLLLITSYFSLHKYCHKKWVEIIKVWKHVIIRTICFYQVFSRADLGLESNYWYKYDHKDINMDIILGHSYDMCLKLLPPLGVVMIETLLLHRHLQDFSLIDLLIHICSKEVVFEKKQTGSLLNLTLAVFVKFNFTMSQLNFEIRHLHIPPI